MGKRDRFSPSLQKALAAAEHLARDGDSTLVIAADYGGRWDIAQAARRLAEQVEAGELSASEIDDERLNQYTALADLPEPDLLIRTGGEQRTRNFPLCECT